MMLYYLIYSTFIVFSITEKPHWGELNDIMITITALDKNSLISFSLDKNPFDQKAAQLRQTSFRQERSIIIKTRGLSIRINATQCLIQALLEIFALLYEQNL